MGVMSGTLDLLQRSFLGTSVEDGVLRFSPSLVDRLDGLTFTMQIRGTPLRVGIAGDRLSVVAPTEGFRGPLRVGVGDEIRELHPGGRCEFALTS